MPSNAKLVQDAWIRKEVQDQIESQDGSEASVFITCDLANSMAAIAEGIPCIYLGTHLRGLNPNSHGASHISFSQFLLSLGVRLDEIDIKVIEPSSTKVSCIQSMRPGKSTDEWKLDELRLMEVK